MEWPEAAPEPGGRENEVEARLAAIEDLCVALAQRLDALDASVRTTVAREVGSVADDLRHTVSELGRLFVRDLGRLGKLLENHRDEIVADLRPLPSVAPPEAAIAVADDDRAQAHGEAPTGGGTDRGTGRADEEGAEGPSTGTGDDTGDEDEDEMDTGEADDGRREGRRRLKRRERSGRA